MPEIRSATNPLQLTRGDSVPMSYLVASEVSQFSEVARYL